MSWTGASYVVYVATCQLACRIRAHLIMCGTPVQGCFLEFADRPVCVVLPACLLLLLTAGLDTVALLAKAADVLELLSNTEAACQSALVRAAAAAEPQGLIQAYARYGGRFACCIRHCVCNSAIY